MNESRKTTNDFSFLRSAMTEGNPWGGTTDAESWIKNRVATSRFDVRQIDFSEMNQWFFHQQTGNLLHQTGRFFSIEGVRVSHQTRHHSNSWDQPIIVQPEIGILGIITLVVDGIRYFLMQAKSEPGNVTVVQISPTLQATESNLSQVHRGKKPHYLDYFLDRRKFVTIVDQLLSEQGSRFYQKRNRNIIVEIFEDIELHEDFCWLTLHQLRDLARINNVINMDARSVLSCLPPYLQFENTRQLPELIKLANLPKEISDFSHSILLSEQNHGAYHSTEDIARWFAGLKNTALMTVSLIPLKDVKNWIKDARSIHHESKPFYSVIAVSVTDHSREVTAWNQPLLMDTAPGLLGFLSTQINGVLHFLVQGKFEAGNLDNLEMAPTISCSNLAYKKNSGSNTPFLDYFINPKKAWLRHTSLQSEEGGRFYHLQNHNIILELPATELPPIPDNYRWMTLAQIHSFKQRGFVNIDTRTLLSNLSLTGDTDA